LSDAGAALVCVAPEAVGGGAALLADAGGDAMYCESRTIAAAMALGSVLLLSSGVFVSSRVGCASVDFAGAAFEALGSAFAPALDCASSWRKFGTPPGCAAVEPLELAALPCGAVPFAAAAPAALSGPVLPLPAPLDRPPEALDCAVPEPAGVFGAAAAPLDPGAAAPAGVPDPDPAPAFAAVPPSRAEMPPLEPRAAVAPVEAAGEEETDLRATPMHSVRWAAL
jgi:hypothetical protein